MVGEEGVILDTGVLSFNCLLTVEKVTKEARLCNKLQ